MVADLALEGSSINIKKPNKSTHKASRFELFNENPHRNQKDTTQRTQRRIFRRSHAWKTYNQGEKTGKHRHRDNKKRREHRVSLDKNQETRLERENSHLKRSSRRSPQSRRGRSDRKGTMGSRGGGKWVFASWRGMRSGFYCPPKAFGKCLRLSYPPHTDFSIL